jgi:hypothetical protein
MKRSERSKLAKRAAAEAKARGVKLGNPRIELAGKAAAPALRAKSDAFARKGDCPRPERTRHRFGKRRQVAGRAGRRDPQAVARRLVPLRRVSLWRAGGGVAPEGCGVASGARYQSKSGLLQNAKASRLDDRF